MDFPAAVLHELKCSQCHLQHDGVAACGRCLAPEPVEQEEDRQYVCPVLGSARCNWLGTRTEILQHCQTEHPDKVIDNPATLIHDTSRANDQTYLLRAFKLLFLIYTKVCLVSGRIFHSLRFLGTSDDAAKFLFTLDIKRGDEQLTKTVQVAPHGCVAIQEPTPLVLDTNSLFSMLGGFDGATFTVTVKRKESDVAVQKYARCTAEVTVFRYRNEGGWQCEQCAPARRACKNQGCTHTDIDDKCTKHESFFCQQCTTCDICLARVSPGSFSTHYGSVHQRTTHEAGSTWRPTRTERWQRCLVSSVVGTAVCSYWLEDFQLDLLVFSPLSSEQLKEYRCKVRITDPATGHTRTFTPPTEYNQCYDWVIRVKKEEFLSCITELDVCVDIRKAD